MKKTATVATLIDVSTLKPRAMTMGDILTLERIGVKLFDFKSNVFLEPSPADVFAIMYVITTPIQDLERIRKHSRLQEAVNKFADGVPIESFPALCDKLAEAFQKAFGGK